MIIISLNLNPFNSFYRVILTEQFKRKGRKVLELFSRDFLGPRIILNGVKSSFHMI